MLFIFKGNTNFCSDVFVHMCQRACLSYVAGMEKNPMSRSALGEGRVVYEYEPVIGSFVSCMLTFLNIGPQHLISSPTIKVSFTYS